VGAAAIALADFVTPLSQINFLPDLMHVKVFPDESEVIPTLEQAPPALTAAFAGERGNNSKRESTVNCESNLLFI
jgi:hypothetical protein